VGRKDMADTKLSNIDGFHDLVKQVPEKIEAYTKELHDEIDEIRNKNLYYTQMSIPGLIICVLLVAAGAFLFVPATGIRENDGFYGRLVGGMLILLGIHGLGRLFFAGQLKSHDRSISKIEKDFKNQYNRELEKLSSNNIVKKIRSCEECEVSENSILDEKIEKSMIKLYQKHQLTSMLVRLSRICIPILLFVSVLIILKLAVPKNLNAVAVAFILMFIFCRRLCLLLEYKTGTTIRMLMSIPALIYGVILYFTIRTACAELNFLPLVLLIKIPETIRPLLSTAGVVCILQVLVLVCAVFTMDYYSERKYLKEGLPGREEESSEDDKKDYHYMWYIYACGVKSVIWAVFFAACFIYVCENMPDLDSVGMAIWTGVMLGVLWKLTSLIWPGHKKKTISKFWGIRYSLTVEGFVIVMMATILFLGGFVFSASALVMCIATVISSGILFAMMVHWWG
jgi:hypothetical protein